MSSISQDDKCELRAIDQKNMPSIFTTDDELQEVSASDELTPKMNLRKIKREEKKETKKRGAKRTLCRDGFMESLSKAYKNKMAALKKNESACEVAIEAHTKKMSDLEEMYANVIAMYANVIAITEKLKEF
jgi:hypothetical protein